MSYKTLLEESLRQKHEVSSYRALALTEADWIAISENVDELLFEEFEELFEAFSGIPPKIISQMVQQGANNETLTLFKQAGEYSSVDKIEVNTKAKFWETVKKELEKNNHIVVVHNDSYVGSVHPDYYNSVYIKSLGRKNRQRFGGMTPDGDNTSPKMGAIRADEGKNNAMINIMNILEARDAFKRPMNVHILSYSEDTKSRKIRLDRETRKFSAQSVTNQLADNKSFPAQSKRAVAAMLKKYGVNEKDVPEQTLKNLYSYGVSLGQGKRPWATHHEKAFGGHLTKLNFVELMQFVREKYGTR